jgi:galactokinase
MTSAGRTGAAAHDKAVMLRQRFERMYGTRARIFRAPARVNLIGEHTDYNDGFVMPAAIGLYTWAAVAPRDDRKLHIYSRQFGEDVELDLEALAGPPRHHWSDYVRGVAAVLQAAGYRLRGADLILHGEVPLGAGLSSSAALEVSFALALADVAGLEVPRMDLARLCQRAENEYSGARCGIMDQFTSCFGQADHALLLDCRSLAYVPVLLPRDVRLVLCNTMVRHEIAGGEYNRRRSACEQGVAGLRQFLPHIRALRDVTAQELAAHRNALGETVYRRCRHVVTENERVLKAAAALANHDLARFGQLMYESHHSLDTDYEVSCEELNLMVDLARGAEGVFGARMTGGGFGGCTVNLVRDDAVAQFESHISAGYQKATGQAPAVYVCAAAEGAGPVA